MLKPLLIQDEKHSTHIEFDNKTNSMVMKGHTIPANAHIFFGSIKKWTDIYLKTNPPEITLTISFEYLHTGASRQVFEFMRMLNEWAITNKKKFNVNWFYEEDDDDMQQQGIDFSAVLKMKFNFDSFSS